MTQKQYLKDYYQKNKARLNKKSREYALENRDKIREYQKEYMRKRRAKLRKENPNVLREQNKKRYEKELDGYYSVYLLEDYNYVGYTNSLYFRFANHKSQYGRDCTNHRILYTTDSKDDALELEALLHDLGYEGKHING